MAKRYRALTGLNYPGKGGTENRAEAGELVSDLPAKSIKWLLAGGHIEPTDAKVPSDEDVEDVPVEDEEMD